MITAKRAAVRHGLGRQNSNRRRGLLALGLEDFFAAIHAGRGNVVTQVGFAGGRLDGQWRRCQKVMGTMHTALGRGLLVLLYSHIETPL